MLVLIVVFLGIVNELIVAIKELFVAFFNLILFAFDNVICLLAMLFAIAYSINDYTNIFVKGFMITFGL